MENKKYKLTEKELGDVFEGKVIQTDTRDLAAFISKEEKDPITGVRRYQKIPYSYVDEHGKVHQDIWDPEFPISSLEMDAFLPPGRYVIKVVNRHNKAQSYGSVTYYNKGENYLISCSEKKTPVAVNKKTDTTDVKIVELTQRLKIQENRINNNSKMLFDLEKAVKKLSQQMEEYIY